MKIQPKGELKERSAALNTQLRFGRERPALVHAYRLRAYLQLRGAKLEAEQKELERVEKVIAELEGRKTSGIQKLIKTIIDMGLAALNPEVDEETTLLDRFKAPLPEDSEEEEYPYEAPPPVDEEYEAEAGEARPLTPPPGGEESDGWGWGGEETVGPGSTPATVPVKAEPLPAEQDYWGSETVGPGSAASEPSPKPKPSSPPEENYWGGGEGYSYDDKF